MAELKKNVAGYVGESLLLKAQHELYDKVADITICVLDDLMEPSPDRYYDDQPIDPSSEWETSVIDSGTYEGTRTYKLQNGAGTVHYVTFGADVKKDGVAMQLDPAVAQAAIDDLNSIYEDDTGKSLLKALPDEERKIADTPANSAKQRAADPVQKAAIQKNYTRVPEPPTDDVAQAVRIAKGNQDRSRVSKEHHEWKYCVIDSNNGSILIEGEGMTNALVYMGVNTQSTAEGVEPVGTGNLPPYSKWIEYEDYREIMKIVRRYRRARNRCGGKALWEEQGYASKTVAIQADLDADSDYLSHRSALLAFGADWAETEG